MDAPNIVVPRPYAAAEPSDVLERSTSLDITPERPVKKSKLPLLKKSDLGKRVSNLERVSNYLTLLRSL